MTRKQEKNTPIVSSQMALDPSSEMQLAAFVDGESGWWQSLWIRKKLCRCFDSRQYVDRLERSSQCFKIQYSAETDKECEKLSVSNNVLNRIAQEERLSLLRSLPSDYLREDSYLSRLFSVDRLAWGSFGAAIASLIFLFVIPTFSTIESKSQTINGQQLVALNSGNSISAHDMGELQLAALNAGNGYNRPVFFSQFAEQEGFDNRISNSRQGLSVVNREGSFYLKRKQIAPQIVDVDWVRSVGRVKVLRDPSGKSSILWVQKKQPSSRNLLPRNVPQEVPEPEVAFVSNK